MHAQVHGMSVYQAIGPYVPHAQCQHVSRENGWDQGIPILPEAARHVFMLECPEMPRDTKGPTTPRPKITPRPVQADLAYPMSIATEGKVTNHMIIPCYVGRAGIPSRDTQVGSPRVVVAQLSHNMGSAGALVLHVQIQPHHITRMICTEDRKSCTRKTACVPITQRRRRNVYRTSFNLIAISQSFIPICA